MDAKMYKGYVSSKKTGGNIMKIVDEKDDFDFRSFKKEFDETQRLLKQHIIDRVDAWKESWEKESIKTKQQLFFESEYNRRINRVINCFDFEILNENTFAYGNKGNPNFRICKYGEKDDFRNCIWIHTHELQEIIRDFDYDKCIESDVYLKLIKKYYQHATGRSHYGSI